MNAHIERVWGPSALRELHALLIEYERDLPADLRHGAEPALPDVERAYALPNAAYLAKFGERCGGCVGVRILDGTTAILQRLYVQPPYRGQGAARALAVAAIGFARDCGCTRIALDTQAERLSAAAALYRSLGFVECAPYGPVAYERPTFMELRLHQEE